MKIGMIVPSSNVTMEIEVPAYLANNGGHTYHSARVRLTQVTPQALAAMNDNVVEAAHALCDAEVDVLASACLVATMLDPRGHTGVERDLHQVISDHQLNARALTSAGALVRYLQTRKLHRVALICPYSNELTGHVIDYLARHDIDVRAHRNFCVTRNADVAKIAQQQIITAGHAVMGPGIDCLIASACVQMPSLAACQNLAAHYPVISAAQATALDIAALAELA